MVVGIWLQRSCSVPTIKGKKDTLKGKVSMKTGCRASVFLISTIKFFIAYVVIVWLDLILFYIFVTNESPKQC